MITDQKTKESVIKNYRYYNDIFHLNADLIHITGEHLWRYFLAKKN